MKSAGKFALGFSAKPQVRQKCDYRGQRAATSDQPRPLTPADEALRLPKQSMICLASRCHTLRGEALRWSG